MAKDLGVRGGIVGQSHLIRALGDDVAIFHDYRAEGPALSRADIFDCELNRACHERAVHVWAGRCVTEADAVPAHVCAKGSKYKRSPEARNFSQLEFSMTVS